MNGNNYHGVLLDVEFKDPNFLEEFTIFAKRKSSTNPWMICGVIVLKDKIGQVIHEVQENLVAGAPYYAHFYKENKLIVVFKEKIFKVTADKSTWNEVINYGLTLGIPSEQLDFVPNKFEDEEKYYGKENFV